jgi:hypothetical protein
MTIDRRMYSLIGIALLTLSACASGPTVAHTEPHGIVVIATQQANSNNYPVRIHEIDDEAVLGSQNAYWLSPGRHTLRVAAILTDVRPMIREVRETRADHEGHVLEINIEEGKRYVIAAHRTDGRAGDWEPVVLEVTDIR